MNDNHKRPPPPGWLVKIIQIAMLVFVILWLRSVAGDLSSIAESMQLIATLMNDGSGR